MKRENDSKSIVAMRYTNEFIISRDEYDSVSPSSDKKRLLGDWTELMYTKLSAAIRICPLIFCYNRCSRSKKSSYFWKGKAVCKCGCSKVCCYIKEEPQDNKPVCVHFEVVGECGQRVVHKVDENLVEEEIAFEDVNIENVATFFQYKDVVNSFLPSLEASNMDICGTIPASVTESQAQQHEQYIAHQTWQPDLLMPHLQTISEQQNHDDVNDEHDILSNATMSVSLPLAYKDSFVISQNDYNSIRPVAREKGLRGKWRNIMQTNISSLIAMCPLKFNYNHCRRDGSRKKGSHFWIGKAVCKCNSSRVHCYIKEEPYTDESVIVYFDIFGKCQWPVLNGEINSNLVGKETSLEKSITIKEDLVYQNVTSHLLFEEEPSTIQNEVIVCTSQTNCCETQQPSQTGSQQNLERSLPHQFYEQCCKENIGPNTLPSTLKPTICVPSYENKFKIPRKIYDHLKPTGNKRRLVGKWQHTIYTNINSLIPMCPLRFNYNHCQQHNSRKRESYFWKGLAACKCNGSKIICYINKEPKDNKPAFVKFKVYGKCKQAIHTNKIKTSSELKIQNEKKTTSSNVANMVSNEKDRSNEVTSAFEELQNVDERNITTAQYSDLQDEVLRLNNNQIPKEEEIQQQDHQYCSTKYVNLDPISEFMISDVPFKSHFKISRDVYNTIRPTILKRRLVGKWSRIIHLNINALIPICPLLFSYNHCRQYNSRKKRCYFWKGLATCLCHGSKVLCYMDDEPQDNYEPILIKFEILGKCSRAKLNDGVVSHLNRMTSLEDSSVEIQFGKDSSDDDTTSCFSSDELQNLSSVNGSHPKIRMTHFEDAVIREQIYHKKQDQEDCNVVHSNSKTSLMIQSDKLSKILSYKNKFMLPQELCHFINPSEKHLVERWSPEIYNNINALIPTCPLLFTYDHDQRHNSVKNGSYFWEGEAVCLCQHSKIHCYVEEVPQDCNKPVTVYFDVFGKCNNSSFGSDSKNTSVEDSNVDLINQDPLNEDTLSCSSFGGLQASHSQQQSDQYESQGIIQQQTCKQQQTAILTVSYENKFKIPRATFDSIGPTLLERRLVGKWREIIYNNINDLIPTCSLQFIYNYCQRFNSRKWKNCFWKGKAFCKCRGSKILCYIRKEPLGNDPAVVHFKVYGKCSLLDSRPDLNFVGKKTSLKDSSGNGCSDDDTISSSSIDELENLEQDNIPESISVINSQHQVKQICYEEGLQQQEQTSLDDIYFGSHFEKSYENKFKISREIYDSIKPTEHVRKLVGNWSRPIITNINKLISTCPLTFIYNHCRGYSSRKYLCNLWKGKALCRCGGSKVYCYIEKEPQSNDEPVVVNFQVFGKCSKSLSEEMNSSLNTRKSSSEDSDMHPNPIEKDLSESSNGSQVQLLDQESQEFDRQQICQQQTRIEQHGVLSTSSNLLTSESTSLPLFYENEFEIHRAIFDTIRPALQRGSLVTNVFQIIYNNVHALVPVCPLRFSYSHCRQLNSRKKKCCFWKGWAICRCSGSKALCYIKEEPQGDDEPVLVNFKVFGKCRQLKLTSLEHSMLSSDLIDVDVAQVEIAGENLENHNIVTYV